MKKERFYPTDYMPEDSGRRKPEIPQEIPQEEPAQLSVDKIEEAPDASDAETNIVEMTNELDIKNKYNEIMKLIEKLNEIDQELTQYND